MHSPQAISINTELDLLIERVVDLPKEKIWAAWTQPELIMQWFCPAPWSVSACEVDLRAGGVFKTTMRSPEGEDFPNTGCYLEVIENRKLVFTDALAPGYRPSEKPFFTGIILLEDHPRGTQYTAIGLHANAATKQRHESMGFHEGWNIALDQLINLMKKK